jgi:energy-converting hydrogenase Eha subunit B
MTVVNLTAEWLLALLLLVLLVAIPIKVGAHLADARRKGILWCALAAIAGVIAGHLAARLFGGFIGGSLAAFIGYIVAIRYLLGTSLAGALGLTIIAFIVSLLGIWVLAHFWFTSAAPGNVWSV